MTRVLSCIQPTGDVHLGNYLGALRNWVAGQHEADAFHGIVDLHALTVTEEPGVIGQSTTQLAAMLFAIGLDPDVATVFVQSHVVEHSQLAWVMECTVSYGELTRMTQFKDKSAKREFISGGLFTYPALQAADILLYDANAVPVGDDQRQHVEITRDIALRFNHRFGETFVVPEVATPKAGARVMDLLNPMAKMSKSSETGAGMIQMLDDPDMIRRKFKRAVTDSDNEVQFDPVGKPGRQQPARDPRCRHRPGSPRAGQGLHPVRPAEVGRRRRRGRAARADPGPLPRAARRPRRAGVAAAQGRRQGPPRGLGHPQAGLRRHRLPPGLSQPRRWPFPQLSRGADMRGRLREQLTDPATDGRLGGRTVNPTDRRIIGLALPALGSLAAEPLYVLVDTAIVGRLGTAQLGGLALAATVLSLVVAGCNFLTYGTTERVARRLGAGRADDAADVGVQTMWLSAIVGVVLAPIVIATAPTVGRLLGGDGDVLGLRRLVPADRRPRPAVRAARRSAPRACSAAPPTTARRS